MATPSTEGDGVRQRNTTSTTATESNANNSQPQPLPTSFAYTSSDDYAKCMHLWYAQVQWSQYLHMNMMMMSSQMNNGSLLNNTSAATTNTTTAAAPQPAAAVNRLIQPASFIKRGIAEGIDFVFCFALKLLIFWMLVDENLIELDRYEKLLNYEADLSALIDITQELFPIEMLTKVVIALLEALVLWTGFPGLPRGCTPGKLIMGIKLVSVESITARSLAEIMGHNVRPVGFGQSLCRSLMKNLSIGFLFPVCMIQYAFPYNRGIYDVATGTIVIEA